MYPLNIDDLTADQLAALNKDAERLGDDFVCIHPPCFGIVEDGELRDVAVCPDCNRVYERIGGEWFEVPTGTFREAHIRLALAAEQIQRTLTDSAPSWIKRWCKRNRF
jgi:hypothetical protein